MMPPIMRVHHNVHARCMLMPRSQSHCRALIHNNTNEVISRKQKERKKSLTKTVKKGVAEDIIGPCGV